MAKKPAKAPKLPGAGNKPAAKLRVKKAARPSASALQTCVLDALKLSQSDLNVPFAKLWPFELTQPLDHIDDACRAHQPPCYALTRAEVHAKTLKCNKAKKINTIVDFIKCIGS
jgi:hypothetical protein